MGTLPNVLPLTAHAAREGAGRDVAEIEGAGGAVRTAVGGGVVLHRIILAAGAVDAPLAIVGFAVFDGNTLVVRAVANQDAI